MSKAHITSALTLDNGIRKVLADVGAELDNIEAGTAPDATATAFALMESIDGMPPKTRLYRAATQAAARLLIDAGAATRIKPEQ